jgi:hypothetical protein
MDIYVLNDNFERVGIIDNYTSLIWNTRYYTPGDFELYVAADNRILELINNNTYLVRDKDMQGEEYRNVMIIDKPNIDLQTDVENGDYLTVTGKCLKSIVARRVVIHQTIMSGNITDCVNRLLSENIINPTDTKRKINNFTFDTSNTFNVSLSMQATGDNLAELFTEMLQNYGIGWDVYIKNGKFVFYLYKGVDRSADQSENPRVVFSYEFDNLLTSDYKEDVSTYANVAIVAGEGEGVERKKYETGDSSATGLNRFEVFVDARDMSTNEGEISTSDYNIMLAEKGNETLSELQKVITFEGEIDATRNYVLNRDFYLGDMVQVINEYGISKSTRIIEIIEADDENGESIIPTFSDF